MLVNQASTSGAETKVSFRVTLSRSEQQGLGTKPAPLQMQDFVCEDPYGLACQARSFLSSISCSGFLARFRGNFVNFGGFARSTPRELHGQRRRRIGLLASDDVGLAALRLLHRCNLVELHLDQRKAEADVEPVRGRRHEVP
jgi:hypothetical protein